MRKVPGVLLLAALAASAATSADTLLIDGLDQSRTTNVERPQRGLSMDKVMARWGSPVATQEAVGQPPITRWEYGDFIVYFEYRHVIHAVPRH